AEAVLARGGVHGPQSVDDRGDGDIARLAVGHVPAFNNPAGIWSVGGHAGEPGPQRVPGMPGTDNVVAAPPGDFDDGVARPGVDATAFGDRGEVVPSADAFAVHDELFGVLEGDGDAVRGGGPGPGSVVETLRLGGQPMPPGDGQEPVRVGEHGLVLTVPLGPVRGEPGP